MRACSRLTLPSMRIASSSTCKKWPSNWIQKLLGCSLSSPKHRLSLRSSSANSILSYSRTIRSCKTSSRRRTRRFRLCQIRWIREMMVIKVKSCLVKLQQSSGISRRCSHPPSKALHQTKIQRLHFLTRSQISGSPSWGKCGVSVWFTQKSSRGLAKISWSKSTQKRWSNFAASKWAWPQTCSRFDWSLQMALGVPLCELKALDYKTREVRAKISNNI